MGALHGTQSTRKKKTRLLAPFGQVMHDSRRMGFRSEATPACAKKKSTYPAERKGWSACHESYVYYVHAIVTTSISLKTQNDGRQWHVRRGYGLRRRFSRGLSLPGRPFVECGSPMGRENLLAAARARR